MDFFCWLGLASCANHVANAAAGADAANAAPEITAAPLVYAIAWVAGVLLIERAGPRSR